METGTKMQTIISFWWVLVFTVVVLGLLIRFSRKPKTGIKRSKGLPPGSMGWPLLGETLEFLSPRPVTCLGTFIEKRRLRYGNVFKSCLFGQPTIVSADADLNKFILANEDRLFGASYPSYFIELMGKQSMLVAVRDAHRKTRSVALHCWSSTRLKEAFFEDIQRCAQLAIQSWKEGELISAREEAKKFLVNLTAKQMLSFGPEQKRTLDFIKEFNILVRGILTLPLNIPGTVYYRALQSRSKLIKVIKQEIMEREQHLPDLIHNDFLDMAMRDGILSTEEILDNVISIFFAGHHILGEVLTFAIYFLAQSPEAVKELRAEHREIRALKTEGQELNWDDYERMRFTHYVIYETLRLAANQVHRKALQDIHFKGYFIPKGWKVVLIFWAIHFDPNLYPDPLKFNPWRWKGMSKPTYYTPFGGGSRQCPGGELSKLQMALFLHHLVLHYDWKMEDSDPPCLIPFLGLCNMRITSQLS